MLDLTVTVTMPSFWLKRTYIDQELVTPNYSDLQQFLGIYCNNMITEKDWISKLD
jgi:hypothetical protein